MARLARLTVPGHPHHLIQRGNDRQPVFRDDEDRLFLLQLLAEHAARAKVAIHAWVLMDNHFHLLATPQAEAGLAQMMQAVGRRYVRYFNLRHKRSGTLWEGRYKSTLIQTERYLLNCMIYIDLNPVRAGLVLKPADYRWSSHAHYAGIRQDRLVSPHALYWSLGNTPFAREAAYVELAQHGISQGQQKSLTDSALKGWVLGEPEFVDNLQKQTQRRLLMTKVGRPRSKRAGTSPAN